MKQTLIAATQVSKSPEVMSHSDPDANIGEQDGPQGPPEQYVSPNDLIRIQSPPSVHEDDSPERSNDIDDTRELSERDRALKKALDFLEQHNWTGHEDDRPEGLTDLEEELDENIRTGDELSTLDLYFNEISDRDRERRKMMKKGNKSQKKSPMMRVVRSEESEDGKEQEIETPAGKGTPPNGRKPDSKKRVKRKDPTTDAFAPQAEDQREGEEERDHETETDEPEESGTPLQSGKPISEGRAKRKPRTDNEGAARK